MRFNQGGQRAADGRPPARVRWLRGGHATAADLLIALLAVLAVACSSSTPSPSPSASGGPTGWTSLPRAPPPRAPERPAAPSPVAHRPCPPRSHPRRRRPRARTRAGRRAQAGPPARQTRRARAPSRPAWRARSRPSSIRPWSTHPSRLSAAVLLRGGASWIGVSGDATLSGNAQVVDPNTVFSIASITKTFVTATIMQLVGQGKRRSTTR